LITADTRIIITNAIYFNGKWAYEFDKEMTDEKPFYPTKGEEVSVDTMYILNSFNYEENSKAKIIELPYKGNDLSMYVVLPKSNNIEKFETEFTINAYTELKNDMELVEEVKVAIPKFKFETKTELSDSLVKMGVVDAFGQADFSGISDSQLEISRVDSSGIYRCEGRRHGSCCSNIGRAGDGHEHLPGPRTRGIQSRPSVYVLHRRQKDKMHPFYGES
jgi:serpin B